MTRLDSLVFATLSFFAIVGASPPEYLQSRQIEPLLRLPFEPESALVARQTRTCNTLGWYACSDGSGCCKNGTYCGVWNGKFGCCPNGRRCSSNNNPCSFQGYVKCANESFCCPYAETCSRDSSGAAKCLKVTTSLSTRVTSTREADVGATGSSSSGSGSSSSSSSSNGAFKPTAGMTCSFIVGLLFVVARA